MNTCHHDSLSRSIYLTSQALRNHVDRLLKPFDLTREQLHILKNIDLHDARSQSEIGTLTGKSPANITRILDRLEKKKLIHRRDNPEDRRSQIVVLTAAGTALCSEMSQLFQTFSGRIEHNIDKDDMAVVIKVLGQIEENLLHLSKDSGD